MEDVAAGDTVGALKVERRDRVASEDVVTKVRREAEQGFEHPILELLLAAVPVALGKRFGHRGAVHDAIGPVPARRQTVESLGDQFLAGAALAADRPGATDRGRAGADGDRAPESTEARRWGEE